MNARTWSCRLGAGLRRLPAARPAKRRADRPQAHIRDRQRLRLVAKTQHPELGACGKRLDQVERSKLVAAPRGIRMTSAEKEDPRRAQARESKPTAACGTRAQTPVEPARGALIAAAAAAMVVGKFRIA